MGEGEIFGQFVCRAEWSEGGEMMVSIDRICAWKEKGTKIVAKVFVGLASAHAKRKVEGNNVAQLQKCKIH